MTKLPIGIIAMLSLALAPPAYAAPTPQQFCAAMTADPTPEGIIRYVLKNVDLNSDTDLDLADENLRIAALITCPEHRNLYLATMEKMEQASSRREFNRISLERK